MAAANLNMVIRIRRLRLMEWLCASILFAMGLHLLAFPSTFYRPSMTAMGSILSYNAWVMILLVSGVSRMVALWINGRWPEGTPQIRLLGAFFGTAIFGVMAGAFASASAESQITINPSPSLAVTVYLVLMCGEIVSCGFAISDFIHARRAMK